MESVVKLSWPPNGALAERRAHPSASSRCLPVPSAHWPAACRLCESKPALPRSSFRSVAK